MQVREDLLASGEQGIAAIGHVPGGNTLRTRPWLCPGRRDEAQFFGSAAKGRTQLLTEIERGDRQPGLPARDLDIAGADPGREIDLRPVLREPLGFELLIGLAVGFLRGCRAGWWSCHLIVTTFPQDIEKITARYRLSSDNRMENTKHLDVKPMISSSHTSSVYSVAWQM